MLLATTLLAAGLALAFATLRAATATATRGEALAQRSERMRAVEGFLRRRLGSDPADRVRARPGQRPGLALHRRRAHMRFVADLPDYLGRGGPYLHDLQIERDGDGVRLTLALTMVLAGRSHRGTATAAA